MSENDPNPDPARNHIHRENLEAILANAVDAIVTISENGIVESVNPATEKLFGYTAEEVVGQNVSMLMPNPYRDQHDTYMQNYLSSGIRKIIGIGREVTGRRKDGTDFPIHLAVSEIRTGEKRMFTGIIRDISDVKEAERRLTEANERLEERVRERTKALHEAQAELLKREKLATLGQVAGGIAHEIRNPLNAVKTSAYYLSNARTPSPEKVREHLDRIDRQVTMIDNVITALSDVAKLPDARRQPVDIEKLLRTVTSATTLPADIEVVFDFEDDLPACLIDEIQMPIALRNLIRNARDAMPEGGRLTVGARKNGHGVEAFVQDNGVGIDSSQLDKIMEPLFTTKARGMGLGLAITRAIVEKNKCELVVESTTGEGSRFSIRIPIAAGQTTS